MKTELPIIDESQLIHGEPELVKELFGLLANELPQMKVLINNAINSNDEKAAREQLHKLQGSCVYCGLVRLKNSSLQLDQAVKQKSSTVELLQEFNADIDKVMLEIKKRGLI